MGHFTFQQASNNCQSNTRLQYASTSADEGAMQQSLQQQPALTDYCLIVSGWLPVVICALQSG